MTPILYTVEMTEAGASPVLVKTSAKHPAIAVLRAAEDVFDPRHEDADESEIEMERSRFLDALAVRVWEGHHDEAPRDPPVYVA